LEQHWSPSPLQIFFHGVGAVADGLDRLGKLVAAHTKLLRPVRDLLILAERDA
jgi:hypothetical protein